MKKIIVPVDFSQQSEYAMKVAVSLAKKHGFEILALHMLELNQAMITSTEDYHPEQTVFLIKMAEKRFDEFLKKPFLNEVKVTPIIKHYKVFSEVNEIAKEHEVGLVVMGSHGADGLTEIFIGSNAEKVVRTSDIPVIVVKGEMEDFNIKRFVFACDFSLENLTAFSQAKAFASMLSAELNLVYVNTPGDSFLSTSDCYERINKFLHEAKSAEEVTIYNDYTVEKGVLGFSEVNGADAIGIPTHGRRGLAHFFMGSIGEDIANHSKIPVITFKIND
ncbi:universal stress protein [Euzebyella marina]|uniref:Universal stress protein n=1 Tax=Euzebyella marina TaxID=1761453 RepID=A0A3G2L2G8_9FLAO|nr:universal stress protein [Euzebyella marina]AYN66421.1 universal stress protein [Euzebyella marina]